MIGNIRPVLRLTNNALDTCYDVRSGVRGSVSTGRSNIDPIIMQLLELRNVLDTLFMTSMDAPGSTSSSPPPQQLIVSAVNEALSRCRMGIIGVEDALQNMTETSTAIDESNTPSSLRLEIALGDLTSVTNALKDALNKGGSVPSVTSDY